MPGLSWFSRIAGSAFCRPVSPCWEWGVLAELVLYPIGSIIHVVGSDRLASVPLGFLMLVGLIGYLLACANIWRSALDSGIGLGVAVSVGYLLLSIALEQQLLPDT